MVPMLSGTSNLIPQIGSQAIPPSSAYYPKRFSPPSQNDTPRSLFHEKPVKFSGAGLRFTRISDAQEMLIFVDGSCLDNGKAMPSAGCAFVFCPGPTFVGKCAFRLERRGPTGAEYKQTSNRAELRAVIAALQFRFWYGEGYARVVIATDSEYVVKGITEWVEGWAKNGWRTNQGKAVKNQDLWKQLLGEIEKYQEIARTANWLPPGGPRRLERDILFWHIPRILNAQADMLAKEAAAEPDVVEQRQTIGLPLCGPSPAAFR